MPDDLTSPPDSGFPTPYALELGRRLRAVRTQQGLSLHAVQNKSKGRWKAVVIGSYERGDRAVTVSRLAELADFYGVPISALLPPEQRPGAAAATPPSREPRLVIDLQQLERAGDRAAPLFRYTAAIQSQRGDYNGRLLSVRQDDLRSLAAMYDRSPDQMLAMLSQWGLVAAAG